MAKIRVHQLAEELGKDKRELVEYLIGKGYSQITAVSNVPEHEVELLRQQYGKKPAEPAENAMKAEDAAAREVKNDETLTEDEKPKKKTIIRVYRAQNATEKLRQRRPKPAPQPAPVREDKPAAKAEAAPAPVSDSKPAPEPAAAPAVPETPAAVKTAESSAAVTETKTAEPTAKPVETVQEVKASEMKTTDNGQKKGRDADNRTMDRTAGDKAPAASASAARADGARAENAGSRETRGGDSRGQQRQGDSRQGGAQRQARSDNRGDNRQDRNGGRRFGDNARGGQNSRGGDRTGDRSGQGTGQRFQGDRTRGDRNNAQGGFRTGGAQNRDGRSGVAGQGGQTRSGRPGQNGPSRPFTNDRNRPGRGPAVQETPADSSLAKKTTRDYRDKHHEKEREERRNNNKETFGTRRDGRQFNRIPKALQNQKPKEQEVKKEKVTEIVIPERITIRDLAEAMKIQPAAIVKELFMKGEMVTVNHEVTFEKAQEIALGFDVIAEMEEKEDVIGKLLAEEAEDERLLESRPPVVCVMGHVDHGKTSLLDAIRDTHVTDREAGGITQHIGAYMVSVQGQKITFLDTPGHEAFTAMRMRGANSTDIAVLVVAADDGIMPQTVEAINHAKAAGVEIIVAVNKIDKPAANIERVKQELTEYGLIAEDWGGQTIVCPVSAKTKEGIDDLLSMILLTAEVNELKANPNRKARGLVLEAKLDKGRGPVATILIQKGTLRQGDFIACGAASGKVRAMTDEKGKTLRKATPSMPVEIIGLNAVPGAGEVLVALNTDKEAKEFAATFVNENKKELLEATRHQMSLDDLFNQIQEGTLKELPIVVKADVQGSVEAVKQSLLKLSNDEIVVKVIHGGVGAINESDVSLAAASNAIIIGFNVRPDTTAKAVAEQEKVEIKLYNVIYQAIEDVERAIKGMRAAVYEERVTAHVEIRQIFKASGVGNIAGSYVKDGTVERGSLCRIFHEGEKIYEGKLASLKRFKDDVKEVREGFECGLVFDGFHDFNLEDIVETYKMVEVEPK